MKTATKPAIILFAHGSRDPEWVRPFRKIQRAIRARLPAVKVEMAFLEIMEPALDKSVAELAASGCKNITVAPLFMGQGAHLKNDLSKILDAVRAEHPGVRMTLLPALGETDAILDAISDWLVAAATR